jgi:hypothetical protein
MALGLASYLKWGRGGHSGETEIDRSVRVLVTTEEQILRLTGPLHDLAEGLLNFQLPETRNRQHFREEVEVRDILSGAEKDAPASDSISVTRAHFGISPDLRSVSASDLDLWAPLFAEVLYFENAGLKIVDAAFEDDRFTRITAQVSFQALARSRMESWMSISAKQDVTWSRPEGSGPDAWRICRWEMKKMETIESQRLLFTESLDEALPGSDDRFRSRRSLHEEAAVRYYTSNKTWMPSRFFSPISANQKPAVSVADFDGDGFDDIYIMVRLGNNLLLRNRGDGTFREEAAEHELAISGDSTSGIFADFDNDGDLDLFLGRSMERCQYLENGGGWFRAVEVGVPLPYFAVSLSAADYNGDGLLDVYISTYRPAMLEGATPSGGAAAIGDTWPEEYFSPEEAREYRKRFAATRQGGGQYGSLLEQSGPPNILLANRGKNHFERAAEGQSLELWRNSLQATWADYDADGDPDLYVANDWADDNLFRNDGEKGFADVTKEAGITSFGFAMGASWGDYDNDGRLDVYVSNMFSKAGRRITRRVEGINHQYSESAEGNYLYRQQAAGLFGLVSGLEPPKLLVAEGGWSWGGQFADFDNDADLDIYTLSGYFTAPPEVASDVDL